MATTILQALEQANEAAGIRSFSFADIREFNSFNDSFKFEEYPVNVVIPFSISGNLNQDQIAVKQLVAVTGWILTRISEDTNDVRKKELEAKYMEPMRHLAKLFMRSLASSSIVDSEVQQLAYTIRPEYYFLKDHLFGCAYTINLPLQSRVC